MYDYVIPKINTKLTLLFLLARTPTYVLNDAEQIYYTLIVYGYTKQPSERYLWILTKTNDF